MKKQNLLRFSVFLALAACSARHPGRGPTAEDGPDYTAIFRRARESLIKQEASKAKLKKVPESQLVEFLQSHPEWVHEDEAKLIAEVQAQSKGDPDPTKHTRLIPPSGTAGFEDVKFFVTHPYYQKSKLRPKDDLVAEWIKFINRAQREIILNVYEFDVVEVAEALAKKALAGVTVQVGIDKDVAEASAAVQNVVAVLRAAGVKVTLVDSTGLNHQKVTAIDWSDQARASVLFSSGNLTYSCISPGGDLHALTPVPAASIPNANHLITMKSWILATLVKHELTKTLDEDYLVRGQDYPISGSYQVTGPGVDPYTLEAYPEPSLVVTFAPNGGLKNINKNLIADILKRETGSVRLLQFAFSSKDVDDALLFRARQDIQATGKFDFLSVGDTPFALREFSRVLFMSGYKMDITPKSRTYVEHRDGDWWKGIGEAQIRKLRKNIYTAPKAYGESHFKVGGTSVKTTAKIHHKVLATPNFAIVGTSFNFSQSAEGNNEQILVFRDRAMSENVSGMVKYLVKHSGGTVSEAVILRQKRKLEEAGQLESEDLAAEPGPL